MKPPMRPDGQTSPPRQVVRGIGSGILFMTFFAAYWAFVGGAFLGGVTQLIVFGFAAILTLAFFVAGVYVLWASRRFPLATSAEDLVTGKRISRWFGLIFGLEIVLIALASVWLTRSDHGQYLVPVVALIVGLHFLPLARLFDAPVYWVTGAALSLLGLIEIVCLLRGLPLAGPDPYNWSRVGAQGAAIILWLTLAYVVARARQLLREAATSPGP